MPERGCTDRPLRFLVVERDEDVGDLFKTLFEFLGYEIKAVQSPEQALVWAPQLMPDIIYTSLVFKTMHGFELCSLLRQMPELANTRIVALTGLDMPGIRDMCSAAGFDQYLLKPFTMDALAETIDQAEGEKIRRLMARDSTR